jgi:predicted oxidoreductase
MPEPAPPETPVVATLATLAADLRALAERLTTIEATLCGRLDALARQLEREQDRMAERCAALDAGQATLQSRLARVETRVAIVLSAVGLLAGIVLETLTRRVFGAQG